MSNPSHPPTQQLPQPGLRKRRTRTHDPSSQSTLDSFPQDPTTENQLSDIRPRRERTRQDDYLYYSLAGPPAPPPRYDQHQTYFDEGYLDLNPWMRQEDEGPSFTLARNFPRIVRWKRRGDGSDGKGDADVEADEKGEREAAPQVEAAEELGEDVQGGQRERDSVDEAGTIEGEEEAKRLRRQRHGGQRDNNDGIGNGIAATRTHLSAKSQQREPTKLTDQERNPHKPFNVWALARLRAQRPLGEFLGMTIYTFVGIGSNLAAVTSRNEAGTMETQYWAWGFATMIGIYISGGSSGAFLNPSLIVSVSLFRGFPSRRLPLYILIQILGAFVGTLLAFAVHRDNVAHLDGGALVPSSTGVAMYTQPQDWVRPSTAFTTELLGSAVLTCTIFALGDSGNSPPGAGMHALIIGLVVTATSMSTSYPTRGCFNPARDLGPRLAALAVGYPLSVFNEWDSWWIWGGWVAPVVGGVVGALAYDLCVFKGGESPVNYSFGRWRRKALEGESRVLRKGLRSKRHVGVDRRLESGRVLAREDRRE